MNWCIKSLNPNLQQKSYRLKIVFTNAFKIFKYIE